jgi:hypothetical protein
MAKIITLGCEVADVHRRYAAVHSALFGASSFRLVIDALAGRAPRTFERHRQTLEMLQARIAALAEEIEGLGADDRLPRGGAELSSALLEYAHSLAETIGRLYGICGALREDEPAYRLAASGQPSRFDQDRIGYDYASRHQAEQAIRRLLRAPGSRCRRATTHTWNRITSWESREASLARSSPALAVWPAACEA